jgi:hypothetical protein
MSVPAANAERVLRMRGLLEAAFAPVALEVVDDSSRHIGHAGARDGLGHFTVDIVSEAFDRIPHGRQPPSGAAIVASARAAPDARGAFRPRWTSHACCPYPWLHCSKPAAAAMLPTATLRPVRRRTYPLPAPATGPCIPFKLSAAACGARRAWIRTPRDESESRYRRRIACETTATPTGVRSSAIAWPSANPLHDH